MFSEAYEGEAMESQVFLSGTNSSKRAARMRKWKKKWPSKISENWWKCWKSAKSGTFR